MEINFSSLAEVQRLTTLTTGACRFADLPYFCATGGFVYCSAFNRTNKRKKLSLLVFPDVYWSCTCDEKCQT